MKKPSVWNAPTRRAFVAMLGLGAAALAVAKPTRAPSGDEPAAEAAVAPTLWIGHC